MRYGMNPHQAAHEMNGNKPLTIINGEPSYINYLDALNAWQLVIEARDAVKVPVAASFKHVSPAGVATAGALDACTRETWGLSVAENNSLMSCYARARDADPKSSFGDVIAVSEPVDHELAEFVRTVVADAIVAPSFESGAVAKLSAKKGGGFLIFEADREYRPPEWEIRDVFGMRFEQQRDAFPISAELLQTESLEKEQVIDSLLSLVTLRYTQSNSVVLAHSGTCVGIGAGQQSRVDCVRLAAAKARTWWLRRHPMVRELNRIDGMTRQDRLNWQIRFAEGAMTALQLREFTSIFGSEAANSFLSTSWRDAWLSSLTGLTLASDGFLPFRDSVDYASEVGVTTIIEPGGSIRTSEVRQAAQELRIRHIEIALRLFHH